MILQLLKEDCIIAKNYVVAVILIGVGLPVLLVWRQPQMLEAFALPGTVFISSVAFNLAVSEKENMYPKATALLCATPYNRGKLVEEKYLLYFLIYLYSCAVFWIEMKIIPELAVVNFARSAVVVFWIQVICMGIFLPIQYRFGYEKTKLLAMILVVAGPVLMSVEEAVTIPKSFIQSFSAIPGTMYIVLWLLGGLLWLFSMCISKKIFSRIDLF
ncbi:MAG: ABC-2 transporter permease [Peptococcaceae bacterium]|nr:ABC-2 transporter permease [Peptococcaceae bacterium]